jgi:hypothetical protein
VTTEWDQGSAIIKKGHPAATPGEPKPNAEEDMSNEDKNSEGYHPLARSIWRVLMTWPGGADVGVAFSRAEWEIVVAALNASVSTERPLPGEQKPENDMSERTPSWRQSLSDFTDFLNEPPQHELEHMVREYRHEAYHKWEAVLAVIQPLLERAPASEMRMRLPNPEIVKRASWWSLSANSVKEYPREAFQAFRDEILRIAGD